ncbi:hypothetical protein CRYUN_Cryun07bG0107700 [Craigia yunnanensis]
MNSDGEFLNDSVLSELDGMQTSRVIIGLRPDMCPVLCYTQDSRTNYSFFYALVCRWNVTEMWEKLRGKRLMFVGGFLNRGQWISMVCLLRSVIPANKRSMTPNAQLTIFRAELFVFRLHVVYLVGFNFSSQIFNSGVPTQRTTQPIQYLISFFIYLAQSHFVRNYDRDTPSPFRKSNIISMVLYTR